MNFLHPQAMETIEFAPKVTRPELIRAMESLWRKSADYGLLSSEEHMYGEATAGSLDKIWQAIARFVRTDQRDRLLDWGAGAGKMLISRHFFAPYPDISALGVEKDRSVYNALVRNRTKFNDPMTVIHGDSTLQTSWEGATLAIQYDGPRQAHMEDYHRVIMTKLMTTASLKCLLSTKMCPRLFLDYATLHGEVDVSDWVCVRISGLNFGGSSYKGHLYIRRRDFLY